MLLRLTCFSQNCQSECTQFSYIIRAAQKGGGGRGQLGQFSPGFGEGGGANTTKQYKIYLVLLFLGEGGPKRKFYPGPQKVFGHYMGAKWSQNAGDSVSSNS